MKRPAALSRKSTKSAASSRPPKDEAATPSREKLLQTAIRQFAKLGFDGVSTGEIAAATGFSQAIIHYHFGSKDQLWRESMTYLMHDLDARFPLNLSELRDLGPLEQLRVIVRRFIAMSEYSTELSSILIRESIADSDRLEWLVRRHFQKRIDALDNIVKSTVAAGLAKELPTFLVTQGILLASSFLFCLSPLIRLAHGVDLKDAKVAAAIPDELLDFFLYGLLKR
ncbi:hypothetical protein UP10_13475 [Bradyrhizobium sp. LTSPM299]|uniref:TetR/AcrR family transcriptional regulator n=1 Tax=Bradyrhizobium sp. LTSPM299 TaxID=1619233 RepID=UPI0005EA57E4|nr:TetR/AcrR family transcriptional regulator [Bradyrhizobium sp. LTSPM299]KJC60340.1 hypothetical protein UP10_13475 [Bradyrhizobium sp. LTSPM299]